MATSHFCKRQLFSAKPALTDAIFIFFKQAINKHTTSGETPVTLLIILQANETGQKWEHLHL